MDDRDLVLMPCRADPQGNADMDDNTSIPLSVAKLPPCADKFDLSELREGGSDKLGHIVEEILWVGKNYAIYRTNVGVYVHFSDDENEADEQRQRFIKVCPEICELRYLTPQIRSTGHWIFGRKNREDASLFDHNIAQAIMLVMEKDVETGRNIAQQALKMAVDRVTNDNTLRYVRASLVAWLAIVGLGVIVGLIGHLPAPRHQPLLYVVAGIAGATGAMLSIATRLQSFRLKPCNQSDMNHWMSVIRIGTGIIAGIVLMLLAPIILRDPLSTLFQWGDNNRVPTLETAAVLGFVAGFAERLVPNIMRWTSEQLEPSYGTPSQAVRAAQQAGRVAA
jgi:hypothetical protein